ncbi:MAG: fused MFS/spermidine synthase [Proteobacteria bacterium]|nr:fused MFS/spermidine synthase [Pseudomonadota bacterium]
MSDEQNTGGGPDLDDFSARMRRARALSALLPMFFVSGATALVYQTVWARQLQLVFGTSHFAISAVLSAFMLGLAVGGFAMARMADRIRRPLAAYGWLEALIGVYALIFPTIVGLLQPVYLGAWRAFDLTPWSFALLQLVLLGAGLIIPTAAMGATLPLLARFATDRLGAAGDRVGTLYSVNTAGAVFGTWAAGFVLLPSLGLWVTTLIVAGANLLLGVIALAVDRWATGAEHATIEEDVSGGGFVPRLVPVMGVAFLAGVASLIYEVAWTRLLVLLLGASVYAFSLMLLAFLAGIAIGGKIGGGMADRALAKGGPTGVLRLLAAVEVGVAAASYALMYVFQELPFWYVWIFDWTGAESDPFWMWVTSLLLAVLVMTPPAILMGIAFPVAVRAVIGSADALGGPVGRIYGANTLGGVFGAALAGFALLPTIGVQGAIFVAAAANLVAAAVCFLANPEDQRRFQATGALAIVAVLLGFVARKPPWDELLMTAGMYKYVTSFSDHSRAGIKSYAVDEYELVFYEEGLVSVVTVARNRNSDNIWLANNGKVDASTTVDMPTQVLVALLAFQYVETPDDVLVVGLASGVTAGAVTLIDDAQRIDVVELEPSILTAARYFDSYNFGVLDDPRVELIANDGRNHVLLTAPGTYDAVINEPSNPWITGVSNLFTREFLEMGKTRLKDGGVWAQWVQLYGMDDKDLRSIIGTFADVYPHVLLYRTIEDADLVMIGSDRPLNPGLEAAESLYTRWPRVRDELERVDLGRPSQIVARYQMGRDGALAVAGDIERNTDDNMRVEYSAPRHLHSSTQGENFEVMVPFLDVPEDSLEGDAPGMAQLAREYRALEDWVRGISAMSAAARMASTPLERSAYLAEAEVWQNELRDYLEGEELPVYEVPEAGSLFGDDAGGLE